MNTLITAGFNSCSEFTKERLRVLVVEDEPVWQILVERALKTNDPTIEVRFSKNTNQALEMLSSDDSFDLIIADQNLNDAKTGLDLWDILLDQKVDVPFVLLSGTKREVFIAGLMPYRDQMVPRYIEKSGSVRRLSDELASAFSSRSSKLITAPKIVDRAEKETLSQVMKKKYYWMISLVMVSSYVAWASNILLLLNTSQDLILRSLR